MHLQPKISVIVPTFGREYFVRQCVKSILDSEYDNFEVIVVNTVEENDLELDLQCNIINTKQHGSHVAKNLGAQKSQGDIIVFVDDDVIVDKKWLPTLIQTYLCNDKAAGVGGRVINGTPGAHISNKKYTIVGKVTEIGLVITNFNSSGEVRAVDVFQGCNMSFKREAFFEVGGFSHRYIGNAYFEETDICMRLKNRGYTLLFNPNSIVWHLWAPFGGNRADEKKWSYYFGYNHLLFYESVFSTTYVGWSKVLLYDIYSGLTSHTLIPRLLGVWGYVKKRGKGNS